jgi:hypothetical protein
MPSEIQPNAMFVGTYSSVECRPYSGPPRLNKAGQAQEWSIVWHFKLRDHSTLQPVFGSDGLPFEMFRFSSDATGPGSVGRDILTALAGREVSDAEVAQLLAQDPDHMPTKLYGRSVLLIMTQYTSNGQQRVGIGQILALSKSDRDRLQAALSAEASGQPIVAAPVQPKPADGPRMGPPPAQRFDQNGNEVQPQPQAQLVGATADGSADLPW